MFCPQCGLQQATEDARFCSRCGLPLSEVSGVLARRGEPEAPQEPEPAQKKPVSRRRRGLKQGGYMILFLIFLAFLFAITNAEEDSAITIIVIGLMIAVLRMLYAIVFQREKKPREAAPVAPVQPLYQAPPPQALPPSVNTSPVPAPRSRYNTGEIPAEPPSVTEHTTRHLDQEREAEQRR